MVIYCMLKLNETRLACMKHMAKASDSPRRPVVASTESWMQPEKGMGGWVTQGMGLMRAKEKGMWNGTNSGQFR